ncbi:uncharacterized protein LOC585539 isoform X2 [Strongylocentrotus purpuratus]|uniref:Uncharacterized protein n=1 Tax=Strongylocentrotus purpuratus TaxID=7668 RepID=A0A7M7HHF4_STRPU|nr:uncharacterized protein LOC585539 isoform X2 [Strongylocentrotus purpuratus]|eukprot:XP_011676664.1 PREDICTED: uncharacterized protein LOC585539 isoform X2 [Strongylocentrotus purpuratus]
MARKAALPILMLVLTVVSCIFGAPAKHVPPQAKSVQDVPSHITKGDVLLLKEKLEELEADLDQLEPQVPVETTGDDDEDEADIEPVDETDEEEEIARPPVEKVPDIPTPVEQQLPESVPAKHEMESDLVVEHPEEAKDEGLVGEGGAQDDGVEADGEWGEEEAVHEGIMPYRDPVDDDLYLRKLIVQALTVLYRKDADRIDTMLQGYENQLLEDDVFSENIAPAPQDLRPNPGMGGQKMEASVFAERPFTNEELHQEEVLQAMAAKKKQDINTAEHALLFDMQTFEGEGITLDDLLKDLEDKKKNPQSQVPLMEPRNAINETDEEEEAMFGEYKEDVGGVNDVDKEEEDLALSLQELQKTSNEGVNDVEHEVDDDEEEDADDLLMELMLNLNTSLKKLEEHKAALPK